MLSIEVTWEESAEIASVPPPVLMHGTSCPYLMLPDTIENQFPSKYPRVSNSIASILSFDPPGIKMLARIQSNAKVSNSILELPSLSLAQYQYLGKREAMNPGLSHLAVCELKAAHSAQIPWASVTT